MAWEWVAWAPESVPVGSGAWDGGAPVPLLRRESVPAAGPPGRDSSAAEVRARMREAAEGEVAAEEGEGEQEGGGWNRQQALLPQKRAYRVGR